MEIDIPDDIDITQCPGLVEINHATPNWKKDMIEKKNKEKIEEYVKDILKKREQAAKWRNVPEWKRALLMKKDQEEQDAALAAMNLPASTPSPDKKTPEKKTPEKKKPSTPKGGEPPVPKPKPKCEIDFAALGIDPEEFESMPPWKKELLTKRDKLPPTFGNEYNPDEDGEQGHNNADQQS